MIKKIKDQMQYPDFMQYGDIFSIYKGKGERADLKNDRSI